MGVAVQKAAETKGAVSGLGLAGASLFGVIYVILGYLLVMHAIPWLWWLAKGSPAVLELTMLEQALRLTVMVAVTLGLIYLWPRLVAPQPGLRAGIVAGLLYVIFGLFLVYLICVIAETLLPEAWKASGNGTYIGLGLAVGVGLLWLSYVMKTFQKESFQRRLLGWEEQGWFTVAPYKRGQGVRARRATMLGLLLVIGAGLWAYGMEGRAGSSIFFPWGKYWAPRVPFTADVYTPLIWAPNIVVPLFMGLATIWLTYRVVNYPQFADFLIATEGEMHKVSWSSRKRLIQDTIVVLTTLLLMAIFLFAVDSILVAILRWIGVWQI